MERRGFFSLSEHLDQISKDALEVLEATVDFDYFRGWLVEGLGYGDGAKGGRPPFDPVSMFKAMILQAQHNLKKMEFMIRCPGCAFWISTLAARREHDPPVSQQTDENRDLAAGDEGF